MKYQPEEKEAFINRFRDKTKKFAVDVIHFCDEFPNTTPYKVIAQQLIKSATSTGANYRAACRGRSKKEFFAKLSITLEEADESLYWLEVVSETKVNHNKAEVKRLQQEIEEIIKVLSKARKSISWNQ